MKEYRLTDWLPTTKKEVELRGWDELDVILFSGDAYVDHPSFGAAVIGRILEAEGLRVAIIPQPNWRDDLRDFKKLGRPRLFFGISPGCMDSMVNKYTANKRLRSDDAYTPDARPDMRPEYPSIVYTQILKKLFPDVPVVLGGIEASMRRLTHYDYWQDRVRPSILLDSGADSLIYGMGEKPVVELAERLKRQQTQMDAPSFKKLIADIRTLSNKTEPLSSVELPTTAPAPTMALPRINAQWRISAFSQIISGPARLALFAIFAFFATQMSFSSCIYLSFGSCSPSFIIKSESSQSASHGYCVPSKSSAAMVLSRLKSPSVFKKSNTSPNPFQTAVLLPAGL